MKKNKKYILQIGNSPTMLGGITSVMRNIMYSNELKQYNFKAIYTVSQKNKIIMFISAVFKILILKSQNKIEIAHLHMASKGSFYRKIILIYLLKLLNIPVILHSHGGGLMEFYNSLNSIIKKVSNIALNKVDYIIVLTPTWKSFYSEIIKNKDNIEIIGNFVEIPSNNREICVKNDIIKILFLGRICAKKGVYDLLRAIDLLNDRNINCHLILGGNGEIDKCNELVNKMKISNRVTILGWLDDIKKKEYLNQIDILALPSYYESFGIVLLEAMSYKKPIVASTGGQIKDVVRDGIDGILVEPGDIIGLAKAFEKLISDEKLRKFMGENGYENFTNNFTENIITNKYIKVYNKIIKSN